MAKRSNSKFLLTFISAIFIWFFVTFRIVTIAPFYQAYDACALYALESMLSIQRYTVDPLVSWYQYFAEKSEYDNKIKKLEDDYAQVSAAYTALQATLDYEKEIQELSDFARRYDMSYAIRASVVERYITDQVQSIFVDVGSQSGVEEDMVAIYANQLIGRVDKVYPRYSKVILITDPLCKVGVYCCATKSQGIHQGLCKKNETTLLHVSHLSNLEIDDLVLSSGEGLIFPRGFALGKIRGFNQKNLLYEVSVEPLFDVTSIAHCLLIKKGDYDARAQSEELKIVVPDEHKLMIEENQ